jgi:hypothetical protein
VPFAAQPIPLSDEPRRDLNEIAQSRSLPEGFVFRAKLILMLADGHSFSVIKPRLQTTAPTIARWKQRFLKAGLEGLDTYHPGPILDARPPTLSAYISTHPSTRPYSAWMKRPRFRLWTAWTRCFRCPPDGLSGALDTRTGGCMAKWRHATPARTLSGSGGGGRTGRLKQQIHIILDSLSAHKTQTVRDFLEAHPQLRLHFTPTYSSWLNQVEIWFAKIERDVIARGVFTSVPDLARKLR